MSTEVIGDIINYHHPWFTRGLDEDFLYNMRESEFWGDITGFHVEHRNIHPYESCISLKEFSYLRTPAEFYKFIFSKDEDLGRCYFVNENNELVSHPYIPSFRANFNNNLAVFYHSSFDEYSQEIATYRESGGLFVHDEYFYVPGFVKVHDYQAPQCHRVDGPAYFEMSQDLYDDFSDVEYDCYYMIDNVKLTREEFKAFHELREEYGEGVPDSWLLSLMGVGNRENGDGGLLEVCRKGQWLKF